MYEDITIREFQNALYKDDRSIMNEEELNICNTEFIDTAGLYDSDEFNKVAYIAQLNNRINTIRLSIKLQKDFVEEFNICYKPGLQKFKQFGYSVKWIDKETFLNKLYEIEMSEKMYISQVEIKGKELEKLRESRGPKEDMKKTRGNFIKIINSLGKANYRIDNDKTTVEELAYMIKQRSEEVKELKSL